MTHVEGGGVPPGTQLNGIYEVDKRIAKGGMGEVYIGHVVQTGDKVAIKMILPEHANNELILDLFRKEASTLHNLYHEAIVRYYVFSVDPVLGRPYLAMEFADGPALGDRIRERPLSQHEMEILLPRVAGGLHAAHKAGIIHRDMSPDNVILIDGDVNRAKIIDFGIAKATGSDSTLIGSGFAGKLNYVSPEQLGMSGGEVTAQSDIYSLGLVLAESLIGHPLPMGGSQVEVIDKRRAVPDLSAVPAYIKPLIAWMLQPEPALRPASMEVVANWRPADPGGATIVAPSGMPHPPQQPMPPGYSQPPPQQPAPSLPPGYAPPPNQVPPSQVAPQASAHGEDDDDDLIEDEPPRRSGFGRFLSVLLAGAVVAGGVAAFVIYSGTKDPMDGKDPVLPKTKIAGTTNTGTDPAGTGNGTDTAGATNGSQKTGDGTTDKTPASDGTGDGKSTPVKIAEPKRIEPSTLSPLAGGGPVDSGTVVGQPDDGGKPAGPGTATPGGLDAGKAPTSGPGQLTSPQATAPKIATAPGLRPSGSGSDGGSTGVSGVDGGAGKAPGQPKAPTLAGSGDAGGPSLAKKPVTEEGKTPTKIAEPDVRKSIPGALGPAKGGGEIAAAPKDGGFSKPGVKTPDAPTGLNPGNPDTVGGAPSGPAGPAAPPKTGGGVPRIGAAPTDGGAGPTAGGDNGGKTTTPGTTSAPRLAGGTPAGGSSLDSKPVVEDGGAKKFVEPKVAKATPGAPTAPVAGTAAPKIASGDDGGFKVPSTGSIDFSQPKIKTPDAPAKHAAIAKPENQPPTIRDQAAAEQKAKQGSALNIRLGSFYDEDRSETLRLKILGDVPSGLHIRMTTDGIAQIYGTPLEYGDYDIKVAAIDSAGLISKTIHVRLNVDATIAERPVHEYIVGYKGGECFFARPMKLASRQALIEVFAAKPYLKQVVAFDGDFKKTQSFEANIRWRQVEPAQCPLMTVLDQIGPQALDNSLVIDLVEDIIETKTGILAGKIRGGKGARLFLYDHEAGITDLSRFITTRGGETGFRLPPIEGVGPQILIAARPRSTSRLGPTANLNQLLSGAQRHEVSMALGFFKLVEKK